MPAPMTAVVGPGIGASRALAGRAVEPRTVVDTRQVLFTRVKSGYLHGSPIPTEGASMAETVQQLLRERTEDDGPAVLHEGKSWTWREHVGEASAEAAALIGIADPDRPLHVGVLLGNTPAMLRS